MEKEHIFCVLFHRFSIYIYLYAILSSDSGRLYSVSGSISMHFSSSLFPVISHARVSFNMVHVSINVLISINCRNTPFSKRDFISYKTFFRLKNIQILYNP